MATAVETKELSTEEIFAQTERMVERICRFDVPAASYRRGPNGKDVFTVGIVAGEVRVWAGIAKVVVRGSSEHRQVVLNVTEETRTITREVTFDVYVGPDYLQQSARDAERRARESFPVQLPRTPEPKFSVTGLKEVTSKKDLERNEGRTEFSRKFSAKVTARVPATSQALLIGYDEHDLFVAALPKQAASVADAHKMLRPKGVDDRAVRQGEWFFQPVTESVGASLDRMLRSRPGALQYGRLGGSWDSTHHALRVTRGNRTYAIGYVVDVRGERASTHHEPLWLEDWHEVIRNQEVQVPVARDRQSRQRRTWD